MSGRKTTRKTAKGKKEDPEVEDDVAEPSKKKAKVEAAPMVVPETDFTSPRKEGQQIKIISWNVAGFKAVLNKGFKEYITKEDPDILCVQETKIGENDNLLAVSGYHHTFYAAIKPNSGYAGVGLYSKEKPISVKKGMAWSSGSDKHDNEGRCLTAEFPGFYLVTTYIPNSGNKLQNLDYRTKEWDVDFLAYLKKLEETKPVIWCGDLNVAHEPIDLANPKGNKKTAGFTQQERDNFTALLAAGFTDTFRHFKKNEEKAYTFWSYKTGARPKDVGWRLDYFVVSNSLLPKVKDSYLRKYIMGSDHCPIGLILDNSGDNVAASSSSSSSSSASSSGDAAAPATI